MTEGEYKLLGKVFKIPEKKAIHVYEKGPISPRLDAAINFLHEKGYKPGDRVSNELLYQIYSVGSNVPMEKLLRASKERGATWEVLPDGKIELKYLAPVNPNIAAKKYTPEYLQTVVKNLKETLGRDEITATDIREIILKDDKSSSGQSKANTLLSYLQRYGLATQTNKKLKQNDYGRHGRTFKLK